MSADIGEKVAEQNVYEKSLPDEAAEKWVRRAFATDCLFAGTGLKKNDAGEKVAEQKVYEKSLPDEAAEKWVRRAFATDRLFAATGFVEIEVGRYRRKSGRAKCL